jgi:hypothetical protein
MSITEGLKSWVEPIILCGAGFLVVFLLLMNEYQRVTVRTSEPVGSFVSSQFYPGQSSSPVLVMTPNNIGYGIPIGNGRPDTSLVQTDNEQFLVSGHFFAKKGQKLWLRTAINKNKRLCLNDDDRVCHLVIRSDSI